ncbi:unnamed protein product [Danaus chrysippus]|uniref:(African queen) hypothetical protein n=1 Tax=Danaus chrysippus TaxID=151541 RepID=A0A8J2QGJ9_9NEOP|nr:unnamed protein product [Danaus chrysippus]
MPSGVIFMIYIPSSNYEHILKFGKRSDLISIHDEETPRLEVQLRYKKEKNIPIHLTQHHYDVFRTTLENITENDEFFTMESVSIIELKIWPNSNSTGVAKKARCGTSDMGQ